MDNQHKLIKGYRDLSQEDINLMNEIKAKAEEVGVLIERVFEHHSQQYKAAMPTMDDFDEEFIKRWDITDPTGWAERAQEDLQTGFMKLVRSVAQPTTF